MILIWHVHIEASWGYFGIYLSVYLTKEEDESMGKEKKYAIYQEYFHTYSIYIDMLCANIKLLMRWRIIRKHRGVSKWRSRSFWESCMWRDRERCQCYSAIIQKRAIVFKLITCTSSCKKEIDTLSLYYIENSQKGVLLTLGVINSRLKETGL